MSGLCHRYAVLTFFGAVCYKPVAALRLLCSLGEFVVGFEPGRYARVSGSTKPCRQFVGPLPPLSRRWPYLTTACLLAERPNLVGKYTSSALAGLTV